MHLTPREKEVLQHLLRAEKQSAIADDLGVCRRTVHFHLSNIRRKVGVQSTLEAAIFFAAHPEHIDSLQFTLW
jgi:DNA-binding NarL/FixJ family response regulator